MLPNRPYNKHSKPCILYLNHCNLSTCSCCCSVNLRFITFSFCCFSTPAHLLTHCHSHPYPSTSVSGLWSHQAVIICSNQYKEQLLLPRLSLFCSHYLIAKSMKLNQDTRSGVGTSHTWLKNITQRMRVREYQELLAQI